MVDGWGDIPHRPGSPAVHDVNSGELPLVEVHIEHAAYLTGVLHAYNGQCIVLLCGNGAAVRKHFDEQIRRSAFLCGDIAAQLFAGNQQLLTGRGLEVPLLPTLRHMVGGVGAGSFFLRAPRGVLRVDLGTDAFVFLLRELVAQFIQHILQMLPQGIIPEMLLDGILPTPVDPQNDFFLLCHISCPPLQLRASAHCSAAWVRRA